MNDDDNPSLLWPALGASSVLLLVLLVRRGRSAGPALPGSGPPSGPPAVDLDQIAREQERQRQINRDRGTAAANSWKDKPLGYEAEAKALASANPLVKQALDAIFAGIRAVVTMPHLQQVADPLLDLELALPEATREFMQLAALRVPWPFEPGNAEQQAGRLRFAGRALFRAAQDGGTVTGGEGPDAVAADLRAMLTVAQSALQGGFRAPVFTSRNPGAAAVIPQMASAWESGYDGTQDLVDQVDNKGAAITTPAEPGHQLVVQAIAQREGFLTAQRGGPRRNPFQLPKESY